MISMKQGYGLELLGGKLLGAGGGGFMSFRQNDVSLRQSLKKSYLHPDGFFTARKSRVSL